MRSDARMGNLHLHLDGAAADHAEWTATGDDDFDAATLEQAMVESRRRLYDELRDIDLRDIDAA